MSFMFSPGCCCDSCIIFNDDFNRTDDSSLGADWIETDWSIASNKATTGTDDATSFLAADMGVNGLLFLTFRGEDYSDQVKLIGRYTDANNHIYMLYTLASSIGGSATLKIYEVIGGTATQKGGTKTLTAGEGEPGVDHYLAFCFKDTVAVAVEMNALAYQTFGQYEGQSATWNGMDTATLTDGGAGFSAGTITTGITVDDFGTVVYDVENDCPFCSGCLLFFDDFDRSDSSSVGSDWDEAGSSGDWEISSGTMALLGGSSGDYLKLAAVPVGTGRQSALVKGTADGDELGFITRWSTGTPEPTIYGVVLRVGTNAAAYFFIKDNAGVYTYYEEVPVVAEANVWHRLEVCGSSQIRVNGEFLGLYPSLVLNLGGLWAGTHSGDLYWDDYKVENTGLTCECDQCLSLLDGTMPITFTDDFAKRYLYWDPWSANNWFATNSNYVWDWDSANQRIVAEMIYASGTGTSPFGTTILRCLSSAPRNARTLPIGSTWEAECELDDWSIPSPIVDPYYLNWHNGVFFGNNSKTLVFGVFQDIAGVMEYRLRLGSAETATGLGTPAPGDVVKLKLERTSSTEVTAYCYVNGSLVHTETNVNFTDGFAGFQVINVGMWAAGSISLPGTPSGSVYFYWDNFSCTVTPA